MENETKETEHFLKITCLFGRERPNLRQVISLTKIHIIVRGTEEEGQDKTRELSTIEKFDFHPTCLKRLSQAELYNFEVKNCINNRNDAYEQNCKILFTIHKQGEEIAYFFRRIGLINLDLKSIKVLKKQNSNFNDEKFDNSLMKLSKIIFENFKTSDGNLILTINPGLSLSAEKRLIFNWTNLDISYDANSKILIQFKDCFSFLSGWTEEYKFIFLNREFKEDLFFSNFFTLQPLTENFVSGRFFNKNLTFVFNCHCKINRWLKIIVIDKVISTDESYKKIMSDFFTQLMLYSNRIF